MATQVEPLLPGNPLAKAEEHDSVIRGEPEEEDGGRSDGGQRQTGVAEQASSSPGQGGTTGTEKQSSKEESKRGSDSEDKQSDEGVKGSGGKREFTDAPPPKVNPWTRKMTAVTVVSVNGQAHHGSYPSVLILAVTLVCWCLGRPGVVTRGWGGRAAVTGVRWHLLK